MSLPVPVIPGMQGKEAGPIAGEVVVFHLEVVAEAMGAEEFPRQD